MCAIVRNVRVNGKGDRHVKMLIPRWRKGTLDRVRGVCLIAVDRNHGKRVRKTEDLALDEGVGGQNWK